jgi:MFS family permease
MLGVEALPALLYFVALLFVPKSPRWLFAQNRIDEGREVLAQLHGKEIAQSESEAIEKSLNEERNIEKASFLELLKPSLRFILGVGLLIGILQQATGINAIYFYATSIFKQTGIGTNSAFTQGVLLSFTSVIFTIVAMFTIDRIGRRPLMLFGIGGIAVSLILCSYGFGQAKYQLSPEKAAEITGVEQEDLAELSSLSFKNDVEFKGKMKGLLGSDLYAKKEGAILEAAIEMNAMIVLIGVLGFIACFALSLGPVMWVMLSEMYPNKIRGLAIGCVGLVNSFTAWLVTQIFPWELSNLGNSMSFLIFGGIALVGTFVLFKTLPETKGKSLEELETELIKN